MAIESTVDDKIKFKATYVIGGHRDRMKDMMVHDSATLRNQSIRLLLALAAAHGVNVWTSDMRQAYLQCAEPLCREVFILEPASEFELSSDHFLKFLKPLYGLRDSGNLWHKTLEEYYRKDLGMVPLRSDSAPYKIMMDGLLVRLSVGYVDDFLRAGSPWFRELSRKKKERFQMYEDKLIPCAFSGFHLESDEHGCIIQN